jgi:hypothetical protein
VRLGLAELPRLHQRDGEVEMCRRAFRIELERLPVVRERLLGLPEPRHREAEIAVDLGPRL